MKINWGEFASIFKIIILSLAFASTLLFAEGFFYMMQGYSYQFIEPNKFVATAEFLLSVVATLSIAWMIYKEAKAK